MFADLRVPVSRAAVEVLTTDGTRHPIVVFHAPGLGLETFVESDEAFFAAQEGGAFRMFARGAIVALSTAAPAERARAEDEVPETRRRMRVHLRGGEIIEGELRYVAWEAAPRPLDQLNEPSRSFPLYTAEVVHHVVKAHVLFLEELK